MRVRILASVTIGLIACGIGTPAARADCATSKNDFEDVYCAAKNYIAADNDLNAAYKLLSPKLSADEKAILKKSEAAWMKARNDDCGKDDGDGYLVDLSCAVETTRKRTQFLRDRAAECTAGACDDTRLAQWEYLAE